MRLAPDLVRSTALSLLFSFASFAPTLQAAEAYRLGISDTITVRVVQWKATESAFEEWAELGGDYVVGADGNVNFPTVGATLGAGRTSAELAAELGAGLRQSLGLTTTPTVTVEVSEYGPIYVSGDVAAPGEYAFAPNLTVIKALALAGGERRSAEAIARPEREMLTTTGALEVLEEDYARQLIRRARLDAQLAGNGEIAIPPELEGDPDLERLLTAETAILEAQQRQAEAQSSSLSDQIALLNTQIGAFGQKLSSTEAQLVSAREQLDKITALSDDGLAVASRVASMQASVADLEARLLDTQTARLQAQQDIAAASREQTRLADQRITDLSLERQTVDGEISALALKIATQRGLVQEAALHTGAAMPGDTSPTYSYTILRGAEQIAAEPTTALEAGDVVTARLHLTNTEDQR